MLIDRYAWMMHEAIKDRPADSLIAMHMCRGNFHSTHVAAGGYDPAADAIFNKTGVDVFFMEYDTERAGGLEPLRLLRQGQAARDAGLHHHQDRRAGRASTAEAAVRRGVASTPTSTSSASRRSAASPPPRRATPSPPDDQRRKLELVVETAETMWGGVDS